MLKRIGRTRHIVIFESAQHKNDGIDFTNVGQELVAEAFTFAGALNEPTNVNNLNRSMDQRFCLRHDGDSVKSIVGDLGDSDIGIFGRKGVGGSKCASASESVVQRTFARVGETD